MSDALEGGPGALILLCAVATLVVACIPLPPAVIGAAMAVMGEPNFFGPIGPVLRLVVVSLELSIRAPVHPRWRIVMLAVICMIPAIIVHGWLLG